MAEPCGGRDSAQERELVGSAERDLVQTAPHLPLHDRRSRLRVQLHPPAHRFPEAEQRKLRQTPAIGRSMMCDCLRARARGYRNTATFITMIYLIGSPAGSILKSTWNEEETIYWIAATCVPFASELPGFQLAGMPSVLEVGNSSRPFL